MVTFRTHLITQDHLLSRPAYSLGLLCAAWDVRRGIVLASFSMALTKNSRAAGCCLGMGMGHILGDGNALHVVLSLSGC